MSAGAKLIEYLVLLKGIEGTVYALYNRQGKPQGADPDNDGRQHQDVRKRIGKLLLIDHLTTGLSLLDDCVVLCVTMPWAL